MKHDTKKPNYFRFFLRKLIPCAVTAVLVGGMGTETLRLFREQTITAQSREYYTRIVTELTDKNISELTDLEISLLMARRTMSSRAEGNVDCAFQLKRLDTGATYDTEAFLFSVYRENGEKHNCFCFDRELIDFVDEKNRVDMIDEGSYLRIQDIYVNGDNFLPGKMDYIYECMGEETLIETYDFTPANTEGYRHIERTEDPEADGVRTVFALGSDPDGEALALVRSLPDDENALAYDRFSPEYEANVLLLQNYGTLYLFQGSQDGSRTEGIPCVLKTATCYDFWGEMHLVLLICYGILLAAAVIIAVIWGLFAWGSAKKTYEMEEYRRMLTNALAHDLKSPLMAIAGYAENLKSGVKQEKQDYYTQAILQNTHYMDGMISDVLELSRLEGMRRASRETVDAAKLLREAFTQYEPLLSERGITLEAQGSCEVKADPKILSQAMANLASNAVKYTTDGGSIRISCEGKTLCLSNDCDGEVPDHPMEPFTKGEAARTGREGSGLGLAIVQQIMDLHGFRAMTEVKNGVFAVTLKMK